MEFINRKDICPSCNKKIESSFLSGSSPGAIDQCWYFHCVSCDKSFKSIHSNQKVFRNIIYILPIFFLGIIALITFIIGTQRTYLVGAGCLIATIILVILYRKNAYGKLVKIEDEEFRVMEEGSEKQRIIQKHKKALLPQKIIMILIYMLGYYIVTQLFKK